VAIMRTSSNAETPLTLDPYRIQSMETERTEVIRDFQDDTNIYHAGPCSFEAATENHILLIEDPFVSGYECKTCDKSGKVVCPGCGGSGKSSVVEHARCNQCQGEKQIECSDCNGKGVTLVIPQVAERRPTTGRIVSAGPECKWLRNGDTVLYGSFCGTAFDLEGLDAQGIERTIVLRIIREAEVQLRITGHLSLRRVKNKVTNVE
jgi:hypothetical protein